jgi:hypothetical protein
MDNTSEFRDVQRVCADCNGRFVWREEDQRYHLARGYKPPKRCPACREIKRQRFRTVDDFSSRR